MAVPNFQAFMLPMLSLAEDGQVHAIAGVRDALANALAVTPEERAELLPSGRQTRFANRVAWAKVYLERAGLLSSPRRGHFQITEEGRGLLAENPKQIDIPTLERFDRFREFQGTLRKEPSSLAGVSGEAGQLATPEEMLEQGAQDLRSEVVSDLLARVRECTPDFFEKLVVELLLKMGYGRGRSDAGHAIGRSGDEGIDGIISEDRLGLDSIYIQAKRWVGTVGRPEIQKFVGALHGQRARKGVFITTGGFSSEARHYVSHIDPQVVLIDGRELAEYMFDFDLGVTTKAVYQVKRADLDYFEGE